MFLHKFRSTSEQPRREVTGRRRLPTGAPQRRPCIDMERRREMTIRRTDHAALALPLAGPLVAWRAHRADGVALAIKLDARADYTGAPLAADCLGQGRAWGAMAACELPRRALLGSTTTCERAVARPTYGAAVMWCRVSSTLCVCTPSHRQHQASRLHHDASPADDAASHHPTAICLEAHTSASRLQCNACQPPERSAMAYLHLAKSGVERPHALRIVGVCSFRDQQGLPNSPQQPWPAQSHVKSPALPRIRCATAPAPPPRVLFGDERDPSRPS